MHEMALMGDILQLVHEDAAARGIEKIEKIELMVGEISNAMPDALEWLLISFVIKIYIYLLKKPN